MADLSRRELFRRLTGRAADSTAATEADSTVGDEADTLGPVDRAGRDLAAKRRNRRCRNGGRPSNVSHDE
jgi:hypothetical protein